MFDLMQPGLSTMGGFTQSPTGQMALLHFANAALQASQNPHVPSGLGFMNALSQGMMGYKKSELDEAEKAWQGESRQMQRETHGLAKEEAERSKEKYEFEKGERGKEEYAYKPGQVVDFGDYVKNGTVHKVKKQFLGLDADGTERWKVVEDVPEIDKGDKLSFWEDVYESAAGTGRGRRSSAEAQKLLSIKNMYEFNPMGAAISLARTDPSFGFMTEQEQIAKIAEANRILNESLPSPKPFSGQAFHSRPPKPGVLLDIGTARQYLQAYGNRQAAEKAAIEDGWRLK